MKITIQKTMNVADPVRAHSTDAGLDLYVPEGQGCLVRPGAVYTIDLGVKAAIPDGYYGQLVLRSSAGKKGLTMPHGVGVIDSGYRGNLKVLVAALAAPALVAAGERICQLTILPLPHVDVEVGVVDDSADRGVGGFGSTGTGAVVRDYSDGQGVDHPAIGRPMKRLQDTPHGGDPTDNNAGRLDRRPVLEPEAAAITDRLLPCEGESEREEKGMDARINLTVGGLMRELQEAAFRYGNDTPVAIPTMTDADYEQAAAPVVMHVRREPVPDDWDLFHIDPTGEATLVIS
jgi:dUTP pyrophosphatase